MLGNNSYRKSNENKQNWTKEQADGNANMRNSQPTQQGALEQRLHTGGF